MKRTPHGPDASDAFAISLGLITIDLLLAPWWPPLALVIMGLAGALWIFVYVFRA